MSSPCNGCKYCPKAPAPEGRAGWRRTCSKDHPVVAPLVRDSGRVFEVFVIRLDQTVCRDRDTLLDPTRFERILADTD
jgi:hypothetical protein